MSSWPWFGSSLESRLTGRFDGFGLQSFHSFLESWQTEEVEIEAGHLKCSALRLFGKQVFFAFVRHSGACAVCLGNCKCSWMKTHSSLRSGRQHSFLLSLGPVELRWNESAETFNGESIAEALTHRHSGIHATTASVLVTSRIGTYEEVSNPHIEITKLPEIHIFQ